MPLPEPSTPVLAALYLQPHPHERARTVLHRLRGSEQELIDLARKHPVELLRVPSPTRSGVSLRVLTLPESHESAWCGRVQFAPDLDEDFPERSHHDLLGPVLIVADVNGQPSPLTVEEQTTVELHYPSWSPFPVLRMATLGMRGA